MKLAREFHSSYSFVSTLLSERCHFWHWISAMLALTVLVLYINLHSVYQLKMLTMGLQYFCVSRWILQHTIE